MPDNSLDVYSFKKCNIDQAQNRTRGYYIQRNIHPFYFCPFSPCCQGANLRLSEFKFLILYLFKYEIDSGWSKIFARLVQKGKNNVTVFFSFFEAYNKLLQAQDIGGKMSQKQSEEASWFMRVGKSIRDRFSLVSPLKTYSLIDMYITDKF